MALEENWTAGNVHIELDHFRSILSEEDLKKSEDELLVLIYTDFAESEEM